MSCLPWVFFSRLACTLGHIWRRAIYKTLSIYHDESRESLAWVSSGLSTKNQTCNVDACKILRTVQKSHPEYWPLDKSWIVWIVALTRRPGTTLTLMSPGSGQALRTRCLDSRNPDCFYPALQTRGSQNTDHIESGVTGIVSHDNHNGTDLWLVSDLTDWPLIGWYCPHVSLDMHITLSLPLSVTAQHHSLVSYPSPEHWTCWLHS